MTKFCQELKKIIRGRIRFDEPLRYHTTFKIGGPCQAWVEPLDVDELLKLVRFIRFSGKKFLLIGQGSNILARDGYHKLIALSLNSDFFNRVEFFSTRVNCGAGVRLGRLLSSCAGEGLAGIEFTAGIPATFGGALASNAGGRHGEIGSRVSGVTVIDGQSNLRQLNYRALEVTSSIIVSGELKLRRDSSADIKQRISSFLRQKKKTQDFSWPSAGCVFRNLADGTSSGKLIELSGLKGLSAGRAAVSQKHANFIINRGAARAQDVRRLMDMIQKRVLKDHGVKLEPEIEIL